MNLCTMCERPALNVFEEGDEEDPALFDDIIQPAGGLHLMLYAGFGMFIDLPDYATHQQQIHFRLCHDCSVKFVDLFPEHFRSQFKVAHPKDICLANSPIAKHPSSDGGCKYSF